MITYDVRSSRFPRGKGAKVSAFREGFEPEVDVGDPDVDHAAEPVARGPGRPSLSAPGQRSPAMSVRLSVSARERLLALASKQGRRTSEVLRDAVDEYLARHSD